MPKPSKVINKIPPRTIHLHYGNLIGCMSKTKPSVNVINIQGPNNECAITTQRERFNIVGPLAPTPSKAW